MAGRARGGANLREARGGGDDGVDVTAPWTPGPHLREVGASAMWTLSSAKQGFGVEQLRDDSRDTYWQSDGVQPHTITVQFARKTDIEVIGLFLDFGSDESYTPSRVCMRAGTGLHDLQDVKVVEFVEPKGWVEISMHVRANMLQVAVLVNHQNGRDTHVRLMKIFSNRPSLAHLHRQPPFQDPEISQYAQLR